jgi:hypothetical protein
MGVHHQRAPKITMAATPINITGPGGNLGYAGSPESHWIHNALAMATSPPAVNLVRNVGFVFISILPFPLVVVGDDGL